MTDQVETRRRGRPADRDAQATRDAILRAARARFGASGYANASLNSIAAEAGVTGRAIYHYFPSKQDLFNATIEAAFARVTEEVSIHVFPHEELRPRLHGLVHMYQALYDDDPRLLAFLNYTFVQSEQDFLGGDGAPDTELIHQGISGVDRLLDIMVSQAIDRAEVDAEPGAHGLITLLQALAGGIALVAAFDDRDFHGMLDALHLLIDGQLLSQD
jgi:AcrR family transcriptional regulator